MVLVTSGGVKKNGRARKDSAEKDTTVRHARAGNRTPRYAMIRNGMVVSKKRSDRADHSAYPRCDTARNEAQRDQTKRR